MEVPRNLDFGTALFSVAVLEEKHRFFRPQFPYPQLKRAEKIELATMRQTGNKIHWTIQKADGEF